MKRTITILVAGLFVVVARLAAQPSIYMIPDIGTPGMNTYVEIIAPVNEPGKFLLPDGMIPSSQLRIRFINPDDSNRIKVSPGVISWNQRLVTFQFFVAPNAALGPVPMRLAVQGTEFDLDTFYIVRPQTFGTKSGGGVIGSSATYGVGMGQRSKRGAMIVDSMVLSSGIYTMDLTDRDPYRMGNQGYLPAIIISIGRVVMSVGASISASANAKDGGPGGGGGGGYGADRPAQIPFPLIPGENDPPLGSGYTGGFSDVPIVPSPGGFGTSSGANAGALNGARANNNFTLIGNTTVRLFAGGPGHPFDNDGRSGGAAVATGNVPPNIIGTSYGGGGNATKGTGLPAAQDVYNGQVVGNRPIVPLHGGGGGASGGSNDSVGGGGGGAIALYATVEARLESVVADGGNGRDGCDNCGIGSGDASAGGAGGSVILGARTRILINGVMVDGGRAGVKAPTAVAGSASGSGGAGRYRFDGWSSGYHSRTAQASFYKGPTVDTLTYVPAPVHRVRGTGNYQNGSGDTIVVFLRTTTQGWETYPPYRTTVKSDSTWEVDVTFPDDSLVYLFAVQATRPAELAAATPATSVPTHVFSQVAAATIRVNFKQPALDAPTARRIDTVRCPAAVFDTFTVRNTGAAPLIVAASSRFVLGNAALFQVVSPALPDTIAPGGVRQWIVRFNGAAAPNGGSTATLRIISNDPVNPQLDIVYEVERRAPPMLATAPGSVAFGSVPVGTSLQRTVVVTNSDPSQAHTVSGLAIAPANPRLRIVWPAIPQARSLAPGDTMHVIVEFSPTGSTVIGSTNLIVGRSIPCADSVLLPVTGRGLSAGLVASRSPLVIVDSSCVGRSAAEDTLSLINAATTPVTLTGLGVAATPPFALVPPVPGGVIAPGASVVVRIRYTPAGPGVVNGVLNVSSNDPDRPTFTVDLVGVSDSIRVEPAQRLIDFRTLLSCEPFVDTLIVFYNRWADTVRLLPVNITPPFRLNVAPPYVIGPNDSALVPVRFAPLVNGTFTTAVSYTINPCGRIDSLILRGERADAGGATATPVAFGDVTVGGSSSLSSTVTNASPTTIRIAGARIVPATPGLSIVPGQFPLRIAAGGNAPIALAFAPGSVGDLPPVTVEIDIDSVCAQTISAPVSGRGIPGGVALSQSLLDFGGLLWCESGSTTVIVSNVSAIPVVLSAPSLVSGGTNRFAIAGGTLVPGPLAPGGSGTIIVGFAPGPGPDAVFTDTVRMTSSDPLRPVVDIALVGRRYSLGAALFGLGFGQVDAGTASTVSHWLVNTGSAPMTIDALAIGPPFSVTTTVPPLPATLAAGDSLRIDLTFTPSQPGTFTDSLRVTLRSACDSIVFALSGEGIDPVVRAAAFWQDASAPPGDVVRIPLQLQTDLATANVTGYTAKVEFNRTLLRPLAIVFDGTLSQGWTLTSQTLEPGMARFTATGTNRLAGTGVLAYLEARAMLGDSAQTMLRSADSVTFNSARALVTVAPGTFTLEGLCTVGGVRLIDASGVAGVKAVLPNPVAAEASVEIGLIEQGRTDLVLYDALGRTAAVLLDAEMAPGTYIVTLRTAGLAAGPYYLELRTPTDRHRAQVVIRN